MRVNAEKTFMGSLDLHEAEEIQIQKLRRLIADWTTGALQ